MVVKSQLVLGSFNNDDLKSLGNKHARSCYSVIRELKQGTFFHERCLHFVRGMDRERLGANVFDLSPFLFHDERVRAEKARK